VNLFVNRDSPVPIHDQLVAQVGQLVACGALTPGERLPSIRGLASRLGIHHLTVLSAYRTLADRGVLEIREGSGVRVAQLAPAGGGWREGIALSAMAAYFVAQARARGHAGEAILAACRAAVAPRHVARLVVVNPHPDLQELYLHELSRIVACPMEGRTPEQVEAEGAAAFADAALLTSTNFAAPLRRTVGEERAVIVFRLASAEPMLARVRALPPDAVAAVASRSSRFVFLMRELLSGVLPEDRLLAADLGDAKRAAAALKLADLVVADSSCSSEMTKRTRREVFVHRLLSDEVAGELAAHLPPEAFRPRAA
jgi:GntR family transcriptional regulator